MIDCGRVCCQHYRSDQEDWVGVARPNSWAYGTAMFHSSPDSGHNQSRKFCPLYFRCISSRKNNVFFWQMFFQTSWWVIYAALSLFEHKSHPVVFVRLALFRREKVLKVKMADLVTKKKDRLKRFRKELTVDMRQFIFLLEYEKLLLAAAESYFWVNRERFCYLLTNQRQLSRSCFYKGQLAVLPYLQPTWYRVAVTRNQHAMRRRPAVVNKRKEEAQKTEGAKQRGRGGIPLQQQDQMSLLHLYLTVLFTILVCFLFQDRFPILFLSSRSSKTATVERIFARESSWCQRKRFQVVFFIFPLVMSNFGYVLFSPIEDIPQLQRIFYLFQEESLHQATYFVARLLPALFFMLLCVQEEATFAYLSSQAQDWTEARLFSPVIVAMFYTGQFAQSFAFFYKQGVGLDKSLAFAHRG